MLRTPYKSLDEMTHPDTLSTLLGRRVAEVQLKPFGPKGWSSTESAFLSVYLDNEPEPSFVVKCMCSERDWVVLATEDELGRSVTLWQHGLLERFPLEVDHAIVACTENKVGPDILMHNVASELLVEGELLSEQDHNTVLDGMAALHAEFWLDPVLDDPALGLCTPAKLFTHTSDETARKIASEHPSGVLDFFQKGWALLPDFVEKDVVALLRSLLRDPTPLCAALEAFPWTLVHGDLRVANLGVQQIDPRTIIMLDITRPTRTVPAVDLAYYLVSTPDELPVSKEVAVETYRRHLARRLGNRFEGSSWSRQLDLCLLGGLLMFAPVKAWRVENSADAEHRARECDELAWWSEQAKAGARYLS